MKRATALLLAVLLLTASLCGCAQPEETSDGTPAVVGPLRLSEPPASPDRFTAENEIYTYERIDPDKTQLVVSMIGNNAAVKELSSAFMAANPDVQVICLDITGGDADYRPILDWVTNGMAPDAMFVNPDSFVDSGVAVQYLENLSAHPVVERFEVEALQQLAVDANVYFLPAPAELNCMIYNKTLFAQYGWELPTTFDKFVALCLQIQSDTGGAIQPWNPNAKYDSMLTLATEAFAYEQLFGGAENRSWYNDFIAGKATFAGHMEPYYAMLQTLIDNGLLREEHFSYSATTRGKEFAAGKIAMINNSAIRAVDSEFEFALMPFPTTEGDLGYVNEYYSALFCVPVKEHSAAERDALDRYIMFFGSEQGQRALIGDTLMVSRLKNMPIERTDVLEGVAEALAQGHAFVRMDFPGPAGETRTWTFRDQALAMVTGEQTGADCIAAVDAHPYQTAEKTAEQEAPIAVVPDDLSILEFSCYIADLYRTKMDAEIGLINNGVAYRGNLMRLFAGELYASYVPVMKPRSFDNGSALIKVSMTGQQLLAALNHPCGNGCVSDSIYAYSGLKCTVAPWNPLGEKYLSVQLEDGGEIDPARLYTVAFWAGTVSDEYITEILATCEGSWEELMTAQLTADGEIVPADDGRIELVWD